MISHRLIASLIALFLVTSASSAWAFDDDDEMTFDPDEIEEIEDDDEDDDDEMTFAPEDLEDDGFDPEDDIDDALDVGVVAIPGDDITDAERDELQDMLIRATEEVPEITVHDESELLPGLEERGADYCSREALCLARIGEGAGVERIVQARVEAEERADTFRLDIDYFDVGDRLFVAYHSNSRLDDVDESIEAVPPGVDDIFGIRRDPDEDPFVDQRDVDVQSVVSYSAGALGVLSLGLGGFFGMRVSSAQSELDEEETDDEGRYVELTQEEANSKQRSMESNARNANLFYGLGAGLVATSVVLFVLRSGDDAMESEASWYEPDSVAPDWGDDRFGVGASWRF